jgi:hypothetical protein
MKSLTRAKAIRAKCLDCCVFQRKEVRLCPATDCVLWPYRFGKGYVEPPTEQNGGTGQFERGDDSPKPVEKTPVCERSGGTRD